VRRNIVADLAGDDDPDHRTIYQLHRAPPG
jgi:hypothetical protein